MSKQKKRRQKKQANTYPEGLAVSQDRLSYLAAIPGLLMCLLTVVILVMDLLIPGMDQEQYQNYPSLFSITNGVIAACGILFWIIFLRNSCKDGRSLKDLYLANPLPVVFFGLFLLFIILSTIVNGLDEKAIHGVSYRNIGIFHLFAMILIYMFLSSGIRLPSLRRLIIVSCISIADLTAFAVLVDRFAFPIAAFGAKKDISAIFFNGNHYGYFLVMTALLSMGCFLWQQDRRLSLFGLLSALLLLAILLLNGSAGCLLAIVTVSILVLIFSLLFARHTLRRWGLLLALLIILGIAGSIFNGNLTGTFQTLLQDAQKILSGDDAGSAGHNRWLLWTAAMEYISQKPLLGFGCEGLDKILLSETGRGNPHNELLSYAAQFGIPAAVSYLLGVLSMIITSLRKGWNQPLQMTSLMAACGYFISSLFGVPMFYTLPFFFIFLGMSCAKEPYNG